MLQFEQKKTLWYTITIAVKNDPVQVILSHSSFLQNDRQNHNPPLFCTKIHCRTCTFLLLILLLLLLLASSSSFFFLFFLHKYPFSNLSTKCELFCLLG